MDSNSVRQQLLKELEINPTITFTESLKRFPTITRSNFDKIKYEYRKIINNIPGKKSKKKSKSYTRGEVKSNFHAHNKTESRKPKIVLDQDSKEKFDKYIAYNDIELIRHGARESLVYGLVLMDSNLIRIGLSSLISLRDKDGSLKESTKKEQPSLEEMFNALPEPTHFNNDKLELSEVDKQIALQHEKSILNIKEQLEE